jgi:hypothetical protein
MDAAMTMTINIYLPPAMLGTTLPFENLLLAHTCLGNLFCKICSCRPFPFLFDRPWPWIMDDSGGGSNEDDKSPQLAAPRGMCRQYYVRIAMSMTL